MGEHGRQKPGALGCRKHGRVKQAGGGDAELVVTDLVGVPNDGGGDPLKLRVLFRRGAAMKYRSKGLHVWLGEEAA